MLHQNLGMAGTQYALNLSTPQISFRDHLKTGVAVRWHHSLWSVFPDFFGVHQKELIASFLAFPSNLNYDNCEKNKLAFQLLESWNVGTRRVQLELMFTIRQSVT